jgi:hypothetical protein
MHHDSSGFKAYNKIGVREDTESYARAKMLIHLIENGLISNTNRAA